MIRTVPKSKVQKSQRCLAYSGRVSRRSLRDLSRPQTREGLFRGNVHHIPNQRPFAAHLHGSHGYDRYQERLVSGA